MTLHYDTVCRPQQERAAPTTTLIYYCVKLDFDACGRHSFCSRHAASLDLCDAWCWYCGKTTLTWLSSVFRPSHHLTWGLDVKLHLMTPTLKDDLLLNPHAATLTLSCLRDCAADPHVTALNFDPTSLAAIVLTYSRTARDRLLLVSTWLLYRELLTLLNTTSKLNWILTWSWSNLTNNLSVYSEVTHFGLRKHLLDLASAVIDEGQTQTVTWSSRFCHVMPAWFPIHHRD